MRAPSLNNKNGSASKTLKLALVIMEQHQRNQQKLMEMFMKQGERNNKCLMDIIQHRNIRLNIDTTKLMHDLGEQKNVNETRANDRSTATTTEKPVPHQEWLDWVERAKQNDQKRQEETGDGGTTNVHTEYINGAKYEWKPGDIAVPQTKNISSAFQSSQAKSRDSFRC